MAKGESVPETGRKYLYIIQLKLILLLKDGHGAGSPCGITEKPAAQITNLNGWLFRFSTYYICLSAESTDTAHWSAPASTVAAATRTDRPFSSHSGSSRRSMRYVEPVLSAPS